MSGEDNHSDIILFLLLFLSSSSIKNREIRQRQGPELEALRQECRGMEEDVNGLNRQQSMLRHEASELKNRITAKKEELVRK